MKLVQILSLLSVATAFGVSPRPVSQKASFGVTKPAFRKDSLVESPLFRDPLKVRGGAIPGWAAYNEALDKNPLTAKALTSLVGWALGDLLAQVRLEFSLWWQSSQSSCFRPTLFDYRSYRDLHFGLYDCAF